MRTVVFRALAGILALAIACVLIFGDTSKMSLKLVFGEWLLAAGFGAHAVFGGEAFDRVFGAVIGGRKPPDDGRGD